MDCLPDSVMLSVMSTETAPTKSSLPRLLLICTILLILALAFTLSPLTGQSILTLGQQLSQQPLMLLLIVMAMALLMSVGLPGSICFWLIAPFHPPVIAALLLLVGS